MGPSSVFILLSLVACISFSVTSTAPHYPKYNSAVVKLKGASAFGLLALKEVHGVTLIKGVINGLAPGKHLLKVNEYGDLSNGCLSTGNYYNPLEKRINHINDVWYIHADHDGIAKVYILNPYVKLNGYYSAIGRSFVLYSFKKNWYQVSCGVVGLAK